MAHRWIKEKSVRWVASRVGIYVARKLQIDANFRPTSRKIIKLKSRSVPADIQETSQVLFVRTFKTSPGCTYFFCYTICPWCPRSHPTIPKSRTKRFSIIVGSLRRTQSPSIFTARSETYRRLKGKTLKHKKIDRSSVQLTFV